MTERRFAELRELQRQWIRTTQAKAGEVALDGKKPGEYKIIIASHYDSDGELFAGSLWLAEDDGGSFVVPCMRLARYVLPKNEKLVDDIKNRALSLKAMNRLDGQKVSLYQLTAISEEFMMRTIEMYHKEMDNND